MRWLRANAGHYGIDPQHIGVLGASAGAHLVAVLATTSGRAKLEGQGGNPGISSAVQAVVGIATPAFAPQSDSLAAEKFGLSLQKLRLVSPYRNVTAHSAPIYLIHGSEDKTVPPHNAQQLYDRYVLAGAHAELQWIPAADHGFYKGNESAIRLAAEFFKKQFLKDR